MHIQLKRTFGEFKEIDREETNWDEFIGDRSSRLSWSDLHKKRVSVVLGEAGIGKTTEFKLEAARLAEKGIPSFFIALNQLTNPSDWQMALEGQNLEFVTWQNGSGEAFFFLDAVDEARLHRHADLTRALWVVSHSLAGNIHRVRLTISSRVTDWAVKDVPRAVEDALLAPINQAMTVENTSVPPDDTTSENADFKPASEVLFVVALDALSTVEARRCARHYQLEDEEKFWEAVSLGEYTFMASRPLDLSWMVKLWNTKRELGTYRELIEANISARLREVNENYLQAGKALSEVELLAGAQELAAAAEFCGVAFISIRKGGPAGPGVVDAFSVLNHWQPGDVDLLLNTAIFDEASFDRVKFHHRSIREYLAACWVNSQLLKGVPFRRIERLFSARPFGTVTVVPARRPLLSWLASINVQAQAWVIRWCPDIFLHEGDAESWSQPSADSAFRAFLTASKTGARLHWLNSRSEYLRVGRALSPGQVATALLDSSIGVQARQFVLTLAAVAKLPECAEPAMQLYKDISSEDWVKVLALEVLRSVGTKEQKAELIRDLKSGAISSNAEIPKILACIDMVDFTVEELVDIFSKTQDEGGYGTGLMASELKYSILDNIDLPGVQILLSALLKSVRRPADGAKFSRYPEPNVEKAWVLEVLPDCFERLLVLSKDIPEPPIQIFLDAALLIEEIQSGSGFVDKGAMTRIRAAIEAIPFLRWQIAHAIETSSDDQVAAFRLIHEGASLVTFRVDDLPELIRRANDESFTRESCDAWFKIGFEIAGRQRALNLRRNDVRALCGNGNEREGRVAFVKGRYKTWLNSHRSGRKWQREDKVRKQKEKEEFSGFVSEMRAQIEIIREGRDFGILNRLTRYALKNGSRGESAQLDLPLINAQLGAEVAEALAQGLTKYWRCAEVLNPLDYPNGLANGAMVVLVGAHLSWLADEGFSNLSEEEVRTAALNARWSSSGSPIWFEVLYRRYPKIVRDALSPSILEEAKTALLKGSGHGALNLVMKCASDIRQHLLSGLISPFLSGEIGDAELKKSLGRLLSEDGHLSVAVYEKFCESQLTSALAKDAILNDFFWLESWLQTSPPAALNWFAEHVLSLSIKEREAQLNHFASNLGNMKWLVEPWDSEKVELLLKLVDLLRPYASQDASLVEEASRFYGPPIPKMLDSIARGLVGVRGAIGRQALQKLHNDEEDADRRWNYQECLLLHSEAEVNEHSLWTSDSLRRIHAVFDSKPDTEAKLYEQAVARLEGIRTSLEEGPFSERDLFSPATPEKYLQLWLASKFSDTPNRQFTVHREEEVDADKRTDIQLACSTVKVCIEIKPLNNGRSYSANSLVEDTLKRQIVGQYLKGFNTACGVLVLLRLDEKKWDLPTGKGKSFEELVDYLQAEAFKIQAANQSVSQLAVIGIDCLEPKTFGRP
ncbi:hypothetical protein [Herbaspirillum huttiense]|uniref:hypothetical protein n=1 Tax=Herbaspirillum huttiense TaxID=863372 RepID=UPI002176B8FE|nr:hypothetical protein [Herbaspirillum huttiense]UWE16609.1 hypothetical protein NY669_00085 [Herbaspirillum huttiense]